METVTLKHIAENVGVSERLVAYALNGNGRVGEATRLRIIDEAARLGYRPNRAARALVTGRSNLLALCLPQTATAYGDMITRIMESRARGSEYDLVVTRMGEGSDASLVPSGLTQVDGAFFLEPTRLPSATERGIVRTSTLIGVFAEPPTDDFDSVRIDLHSAAEQAVAALLARRPKRFAYVTGIPLSGNEARGAAYLAGVASAGLTPIAIPLTGKQELIADADLTLRGYIAENECPDAIMCSNDEIAIGVLRALRALGKRIPQDVAVTGCDGIEYTRDVWPPLSTITQPFEEMVDLAWSFAMRRLIDPSCPPQQAVLAARFVARDSTAPFTP